MTIKIKNLHKLNNLHLNVNSTNEMKAWFSVTNKEIKQHYVGKCHLMTNHKLSSETAEYKNQRSKTILC